MLTLMPDLDRLPPRVARGWARSASALMGRQDPLYLADQIERNLMSTLRRIGDLSPLRALEQLAAEPFGEASHRRLRQLVATMAPAFRTGLASGFTEAAYAVLGTEAADPWRSPTTSAALFRGLQRTVERCLFGPCEPALVPTVFPTPADFGSYRAEVMRLVRFADLAQRVVAADYDGSRLRAPNHRSRRVATKEILEAPLG